MGLNSQVGSNSSSTQNRTVAMGLTWRKTWHLNITTLPAIKNLSADCIVTWSVGRLCTPSRSFTSRFQICNPTNICWVAIENVLISFTICPYFTVTQRISVWSQIGMPKVKELIILQNLRIHHVMIRSELKCGFAAKSVETVKLELRSSSKPAKHPWFNVQSE